MNAQPYGQNRLGTMNHSISMQTPVTGSLLGSGTVQEELAHHTTSSLSPDHQTLSIPPHRPMHSYSSFPSLTRLPFFVEKKLVDTLKIVKKGGFASSQFRGQMSGPSFHI